ncbi:MAG: hypothetical protein ACRYE9_00270 [Janthinobacterium lividum]
MNINLNELLSKVNFNHLALSGQDISMYSQHVASKLAPITPEGYKRLFDYHYMQNPNSKEKEFLNQLDHGEKQAIQIYSGNDYKEINAVLRGQAVTKSLSSEKIVESLMHAAVASHGLNKLPDVELPRTVRIQDDYELNELIDNASQHKVTLESAFISTADQFSQFATDLFKGNVRIIYENVKGKKVDALSIAPENEYMIPPSTQIKWTGHKEENGIHYFTAQGANVLLDQVKPINTRITEAIEQIDSIVTKISNTIENEKKLSPISNESKNKSGNKSSQVDMSTDNSVTETSNIIKNEKESSPISNESENKSSQVDMSNSANDQHKVPSSLSKSKIPFEGFIGAILKTVVDNGLAPRTKIAKYESGKDSKQGDSNYNRDSQQFTKSIDASYLNLKTKLYNLVSSIINHLGIKTLANYFSDKARDIQKQTPTEKKPHSLKIEGKQNPTGLAKQKDRSR